MAKISVYRVISPSQLFFLNGETKVWGVDVGFSGSVLWEVGLGDWVGWMDE